MKSFADKFKDRHNLAFLLILFVGALIRLLYMVGPQTRMSGDESVYAIQALHILKGEGGIFQVFYYNQPYTGTLTAYLGAILMSLFGINELWIKGVVFLFSLIFLVSMYYLSVEVFGRGKASLLVLTVSSLTSPFWANWTTRIGTGYPESTALGNLILLLTMKLVWGKLADKQKIFIFLLGFFGGLGYWIQPTIVYYLLPSLAFVFLWKWRFF